MVRKLGGSENYSYNFRWTIRHKDGTQEHFRVRRCAHLSNKKDALAVEAAHKAALARGDVHPNDPWPPPTLRAFAADFLSHVKTSARVDEASQLHSAEAENGFPAITAGHIISVRFRLGGCDSFKWYLEVQSRQRTPGIATAQEYGCARGS